VIDGARMSDDRPTRGRTMVAILRGSQPRRALIYLLAAVVLPPLLHLIHADIVVLGLAWLGVAGVMTVGRTLLDRLVLAAILLVGVLLAAGLVFSIWPWGLAPVPVGIALLFGITLIAVVARRPLTLPFRVEASDIVVAGSVAVAFWLTTRPLRGLDQLERLKYSAITLDRMAHYALFESIQRLGGFAFEHQAAARMSVQTPTEVVYPQGSHFVLALVNDFLASTTSSATGVALLNRYFVLVLAVYSLGVGAVVWSARWIAGPSASSSARVIVTIIVAVFMCFGPTASLINGADSQLFGMATVALAAALIVRPIDSYPSHVLLASASTIVLFYSYNLYGAFALLGFTVSAIVYRLPLIKRWRVTAGIGLPALAVAVLPSYLTIIDHSFDIQRQVLVAGGHMPMSKLLVPTIGVIVVVPVVFSSARRDPVWRGVGALLGVLVLLLGLFGLYGAAHQGGSYYYGKLLGAAYVCVVSLLGTLGLVLAPRRDRVSSPAAGRHSRLRQDRLSASVASGIAVGLLLALATFQQRVPGTTNGSMPVTYVPLARWTSGRIVNVNATLFAHLARSGDMPSGTPTIVVADRSQGQAWGNTFYVAALSRDLGAMQEALAVLGGLHTDRQRAAGVGSSASFVMTIRASAQVAPQPPRIIVYDPKLSSDISGSLNLKPAVRATVVTDPGIRRP
jgi:hypothetical protein